MIGTVTLFTSAFGGWAAGALADRFGRVRTLQFTILWFAFFTFLCGFAQNYEQLLVAARIDGLRLWRRMGRAAVLVGEVIRPEHRGKAVGAMQSGWAIGWAHRGDCCYLLFFSIMPADTAWRALFWVGLTPALLVFLHPPLCRRAGNLQEDTGQSRQGGQEGEFPRNLLAVNAEDDDPDLLLDDWRAGRLLRDHLLDSDVSADGAQAHGARYRRLYRRHYRWLVYRLLVSAWLDRPDRAAARTSSCSRSARSSTVFLYTQIPVDNTTIMFLGFPARLFRIGHFLRDGTVPDRDCSRHACGARGRASPIISGAAWPRLITLFVGLLSATLPLGQSIGVFALIAYGLLIFAALLLPETKGRVLTAEAA